MSKPKKGGGAVGWWAHPFCYSLCHTGDPNCGTYRLPSIFKSDVKHGAFVNAQDGWCIEEQLWAIEKGVA